MIVQNMPGGGNVLATNHLYTIAPKDGTVIATLHNAIPLHQVLDGHGVRYDASKFNWLGSTGSENEVVFTWHTTGVTNIEEAKKKEVILGGTGAGSGIVIIPTAMNNLLGTKFKMVMGYKSSEDLNLAMQRGEVEARAFSLTSVNGQRSDWVKEKKINFIAQAGVHRAHELPDVPLLTELAKNDEERAILSADLLAAQPRPPLYGAARCARGPARDPAQGLRGYIEGQSFPRRGRKAEAGHRADERGRGHQDRPRRGQCLAGGGGQGPCHDG